MYFVLSESRWLLANKRHCVFYECPPGKTKPNPGKLNSPYPACELKLPIDVYMALYVGCQHSQALSCREMRLHCYNTSWVASFRRPPRQRQNQHGGSYQEKSCDLAHSSLLNIAFFRRHDVALMPLPRPSHAPAVAQCRHGFPGDWFPLASSLEWRIHWTRQWIRAPVPLLT
jgi:hypothetical protein